MKQFKNSILKSSLFILMGLFAFSAFGQKGDDLKWKIKFTIQKIGVISGDDGKELLGNRDFDPYAQMYAYSIRNDQEPDQYTFRRGSVKPTDDRRQENNDGYARFHTPVWTDGMGGYGNDGYKAHYNTPRGWGLDMEMSNDYFNRPRNGKQYSKAGIGFAIYDWDNFEDDQFDVSPEPYSLIPTIILDFYSDDIHIVQRDGTLRKIGTVGKKIILKGDDKISYDKLTMHTEILIEYERKAKDRTNEVNYNRNNRTTNIPRTNTPNINQSKAVTYRNSTEPNSASLKSFVIKNGKLSAYGIAGRKTKNLFTVPLTSLGRNKYRATYSSRLAKTTLIVDLSNHNRPKVNYEKDYHRRGRATKTKNWTFQKSN